MTATETKLAEMIAHSKAGHDIIPFFFQPRRGRSNTVSAAIRMGLKRGLIEQTGVCGMGKPLYKHTVPSATHTAPVTVQ